MCFEPSKMHIRGSINHVFMRSHFLQLIKFSKVLLVFPNVRVDIPVVVAIPLQALLAG